MNRQTKILIELALEEDLSAEGDLTSQFFVPSNHYSTGLINAREPVTVSGQEVAAGVARSVSEQLEYAVVKKDGDRADVGETIAKLSGPTRDLLTAERTLLNFLQRLSGIATQTREYCEAISHTKAQLLDTRKTTPGHRHIEKAAVAHGGGKNHRMGLYDAVMVKDNHIATEGSATALGEMILRFKSAHPGKSVEIETDTIDQVRRYLPIEAVDCILLDNMDLETLREAVLLRNEHAPEVKLEASGGVTLATLADIAETGVDYISVGALTHSVRSVDLGLDFMNE
ncbi:MAG: carboxylating nicotinate-nucleotide diphosphorylase [Verrucomicrobiota bacterium]